MPHALRITSTLYARGFNQEVGALKISLLNKRVRMYVCVCVCVCVWCVCVK